MSKTQFYGPFTKVQELDDGTLYVEGIASSETRDQEVKSIKKYGRGELITADAVRKALPEWLEYGNIREMHERIAAGKAAYAEVRDDNRTHLGAHVVDEGSIRKVRAGVLTGFSLGGDVTQRNADDPSIIEGISLTEISLVDRPCNPDARITLIKMNGAEPMADKATAPVIEEKKQEAAPAEADAIEKAAKQGAETTPPVSATAAEPVDTMAKGMELWDARCALDALLIVQNLMSVESGESHEEAAGQMAALKQAEGSLKEFVASEVQEGDDDVSLAADIGDLQKGDFPGHPFRGNQHVGGSGEGGAHNKASSKSHAASKKAGKGASKEAHEKAAKAHERAASLHEKAGNDKAADYHRAMANYHDKSAKYAAAKELAGGKAKKAAESGDLQKSAEIDTISKRAADAEAVAVAAGEALKKVSDENDELRKRLSESQAQPKGVLRVIEKAADAPGAVSCDAVGEDELKKMSPESRARYEVKKVLKAGMRPL